MYAQSRHAKMHPMKKTTYHVIFSHVALRARVFAGDVDTQPLLLHPVAQDGVVFGG